MTAEIISLDSGIKGRSFTVGSVYVVFYTPEGIEIHRDLQNMEPQTLRAGDTLSLKYDLKNEG